MRRPRPLGSNVMTQDDRQGAAAPSQADASGDIAVTQTGADASPSVDARPAPQAPSELTLSAAPTDESCAAPSPIPAADHAGRSPLPNVKGYQVVAPLGEGGMGTV